MEMGKTNKLKQEIEEYLTKDYCCEFKKECKDGVRVRCSEYEAKLYLILRFAALKEKRIEELVKENAELKADNDARKFAMAMSEKVEKQLREENSKLKDEWQEQVQKATDEGYARTLQTMQLTKAKKIIKALLRLWNDVMTEETVKALVTEAEQFLKENK